LNLDGYIRPEINLDRFYRNPLRLNVSNANYGVLDLEGVSFNWLTKVLAVCGGKQVNLLHTKSQGA
jgi:hypothetical protein